MFQFWKLHYEFSKHIFQFMTAQCFENCFALLKTIFWILEKHILFSKLIFTIENKQYYFENEVHLFCKVSLTIQKVELLFPKAVQWFAKPFFTSFEKYKPIFESIFSHFLVSKTFNYFWKFNMFSVVYFLNNF